MCITEEKGELLYDEDTVVKRWIEYLEEFYKGDSKQILNVEREDEIGKEDVGEPIMEEDLEKAVQGLKIRKAPGINGIPSEPIKKSGENM